LSLPNAADPPVRIPFKERRKYPRFILRVGLRLRGTKGDGIAFDEAVGTATVSSGGFSCTALTRLAEGAVADVFLIAKNERPLGSAKVVRVERVSDPWSTYSFALTNPRTDWFLVPED
jgi:hypothetical protein